VLRAGWEHKFVPEHLSADTVRKKIPSSADITTRISNPNAHYLVGYREQTVFDPQLREADDVVAIMRVEEYQPRNPFKKPYPNVTDIETLNGKLHGQYENVAAALLYCGLSDFGENRKVAAYSEAPNADGISFFEEAGFQQTGNRPEEQIGDQRIQYVHLEAPSVIAVRGALSQQYPWLGKP